MQLNWQQLQQMVWLSFFCHFMYTIQWFSISIWLHYFIISLNYDFKILINVMLTIPRCFTVINFRVYVFHVSRQDRIFTSTILSCSSIIVYHYCDVIISALVSQINGVSIASSTVCSDEDQRKQQSSASLAFVRGIHQLPVNSPHRGR